MTRLSNDRVVLDSLHLEVLRGALVSLAEEVSLTLSRAAYSTNIKTRLDYSCAILDARARVVAQAMNQPTHLGSLAHLVPRMLADIGDLDAGDAVLCNEGYLGGLHLNDVCLLAPLYADGEHVGYVASMAHHVDVGGGTPGSIGLHREIFQEGLIISPVRIMRRGELDRQLMKLLLRNVRAERETQGDLRAQMAAAHLGQRRMQELVDRHSLAVVKEGMQQVLAYTERRVIDEIQRLPRGRWSAVDYLDDDGFTDQPIKIVVAVEIGEGHVAFDFTGTDPQRASSVNTTYAMTFMGCAYALRVLMSSDLEVNDGFYRLLRVTVPAGSVLNAVRPAAIGAGNEAGHRVCETVFKALSNIVPDVLAADSKGTGCNIGIGGQDPKTGRYLVFYECQAGGYGARKELDGIDAIQPHTQNTENSPIEETEASYPFRIVRYELLEDSEGPGRRRGGLGLRRDYSPTSEVTFSVMADRSRFAPQGLAGGGEARSSRFVRNPSTDAESLPSKFSIRLNPGEVLSVQTGGGGGYGSPFRREPERVRQDVLADRVSVSRAAREYGVVLTDALAVDLAATSALRARMQPNA